MINGIHHTSITTGNLDRMVDFYTRLLGFTVVWENLIKQTADIDAVVGESGASFRVAMLSSGTSFVEVFERTQHKGEEAKDKAEFSKLGYKHFALDVTDIDAEYNRLAAAGVKFNCPPKTFGNVKGTYGYDPDGNIFEMQEVMHKQHPFHLARGGRQLKDWDENFDHAAGKAQGDLLKKAVSGAG